MVQENRIIVNGEWIINISKNEQGGLKRYDYNLRTKELKMSRRENRESHFIPIPISDIQSNSVVDVRNNDVCIEGDCLSNCPFGYVCLMNESNELIYQGVMINDKKEYFGTDFYPGLGSVEYCGCYWNDQRHGFGMLFDRKGELVVMFMKRL